MAWKYYCAGCGCSLDPAEGRLCEDCQKIEKAHRKVSAKIRVDRTRVHMERDGQYRMDLIGK